MARGKYAARAANARAEGAAERAEKLEKLLAEERVAHARQVAELKARIEQLNGKLTSSVDQIATAEIQRVEAACAEKLLLERDRHRELRLEAIRIIARFAMRHDSEPTDVAGAIREYVDISEDLYSQLIEGLDLVPGDAWQALGEVQDSPALRTQSRSSKKDLYRETRGIAKVMLARPKGPGA